MDRPLDDLIKEKQEASRKNNDNKQQNKGFSKMKGSTSGGGRQERRQKQEPYAHKVVFQPLQQLVKFQEAPKPKKEPVLTFSVNNTQAATVPQQFTQPKVFAVSQTQTSHSHIAPPQQQAAAFVPPPTTGTGGGGGQKLSIFERIGAPKPKPGAITSGTSVTIGNINHDVTLADLSELCGAIGEVLGVSYALTASKTKKQANVIFARRSDAITFVQKFHNLPLDGVPLSVCLTGENGKENPFNPFPVNNAAETVTENKNVRSGLFGTHLGANAADDEGEQEDFMHEDEEEEEQQYPQQINYAVPVHQSAASNQRFSVTMKDAGGFSGQRQQQQSSFQQPHQQQQQYQNRNGGGNRNNNNNNGGVSFRGNNSSGNNRGGSGGGRGGGGTKKAVVSENDLDNALASYMATR